MVAPLLEYRKTTVSYNGFPVVRDVSLEVRPGEVVCVVGESGSGKSTLVRAAMGLLGPGGAVTAGEILLGGVSLANLSARELRKRRGTEISMVFQDSLASFVPVRRMGDQIFEALLAHERVTREESDERACKLFEHLGLRNPPRVLQSYPFELSGGMGQRVGIATALLGHPRVLLADEPTSALDAVARMQVVDLLQRVSDDLGCAVVLVTHDMRVVRRLAHVVMVLREGEVVEQGTADQVLHAPKAAYTHELLDAVPTLRMPEGEGA